MSNKQLDNLFKSSKALIPYYTFGDPSIPFTETLIKQSFISGADIVELGIPFSDPIADGPVIQASHQRALKKNPDISLKQALQTVKNIKKLIDKPIIFMADINLIDQYGVESFFKDANTSNLNGIIIPDLPVESGDIYRKEATKNNVALIFLVSPLCSKDRLKKIVKASTGFVYLIASTGTTGERKTVNSSLESITKQIKKIKNIPVIVGFGISKPEHYKTVTTFAEGAIVGSHLVNMIGSKNQNDALKAVTKRLKEFKA